MRDLTCILCPIGCALEVDDSGGIFGNLSVSGNTCPRGEVYATEEIRAPKRTVTATVRAAAYKTSHEVSYVCRIPVKTASPCPREKIPALLRDIYDVKIALPVKAGDVIIADWNGEGINVIATRTIN